MARFDKKTMQTLRRAGWHPNRHTDTAAVAAQAAACGYVVGEKPATFLREFDGLSLEFSERDFLFEFRARTECLTRERLAYIAGSIGEEGLEVGETPDVALVVGESGRMYGICHATGITCLLGGCADEGVEFVCRRGNPFKHLL